MSIKPLVKLVFALGIAAAAAFGVSTPPAHALHECGIITLVYSGGGRCTVNCATGAESCTGSQTGTVHVVGECRPC